MGGPSKQQTQAYDEQNAFYQQLSKEYETQFNQQQAALKELHSNLAPILSAGPNQQGYSDAELATLNTSAKDQVAANYDNAVKAVQNKFVNQGGGSVFVPQGAQVELAGKVASSAAQQLSQEQNQILQEGFEKGSKDYWNAENALSGVAGMYNPTAYANSANSTGAEVGQTANEITQANNSWMNLVGGVLGGVGGAAVGKMKF